MLTEPLIFVAVFIIKSGTVELSRSITNIWAEHHLSEAGSHEGGIFQRRRSSPSDRRLRACCFLWPDGPALSVALLWKMMNWRWGGGGKIYLFVLISSDSLSWGWAGWNPATDIWPERRQHATSAGKHLCSVTRDLVWPRLLHLLLWLPLHVLLFSFWCSGVR